MNPSAYDLYQALERGETDTFSYNGETFKVSGSWRSRTITRVSTGQTAYCPMYMEGLIAYQGPAACLMAKPGNVVFDKTGNIQQPIQ